MKERLSGPQVMDLLGRDESLLTVGPYSMPDPTSGDEKTHPLALRCLGPEGLAFVLRRRFDPTRPRTVLRYLSPCCARPLTTLHDEYTKSYCSACGIGDLGVFARIIRDSHLTLAREIVREDFFLFYAPRHTVLEASLIADRLVSEVFALVLASSWGKYVGGQSDE